MIHYIIFTVHCLSECWIFSTMDLLPYYTRVPTYEDLAEFLELESNIFQDYSQPRTNSYDAQDQFDDDKRWNDTADLSSDSISTSPSSPAPYHPTLQSESSMVRLSSPGKTASMMHSVGSPPGKIKK